MDKPRKKRPARAYVVHAFVPVDVRVLALSKKGAARMALRALNRTSPLELSSDDNATYGEMWIDDGCPAVLDPSLKPAARVIEAGRSPAVTFVNDHMRERGRAKPAA